MGTIIALSSAILLLALWAASCRRRLAVLDENVNSAMTQVGIQISSCFAALDPLLYLLKEYDPREFQILFETVRSRRSAITASSEVGDVLEQEDVIDQILDRVTAAADRYPALKAREHYAKYMSAVDGCEKMIRTSRLIYNDSVNKLNRELRMFPASLMAGIFGFHGRDYLEAEEGRTGGAIRRI